MKIVMRYVQIFFTITAVIVLSSGIVMAQKKHKASHVDSYYEDLSDVRPSFQDSSSTNPSDTQVQIKASEPTSFQDASKLLNSKLDTIAESNKRNLISQGYRILVYTGASSDESLKIKQMVYSYNSDLNVYSQYKQPSFRVKVGDFQNRVEASYILNDLKKNFPNAMIVPDQINLVR
jgi:hypothetical protein